MIFIAMSWRIRGQSPLNLAASIDSRCYELTPINQNKKGRKSLSCHDLQPRERWGRVVSWGPARSLLYVSAT